MIAIYSSHMSCSGDTHDYVVAAFSSKEKADDILFQLQDYFPKVDFYIGGYSPPQIDPTFDDILFEDMQPLPAKDDLGDEFKKMLESL